MTESNRIEFKREVLPKFEFFSDRLEITSYGRLPENMSEDEFFNGVSIPRNKELMRIFRDVEMVESLGSGMPRIMQVYGRECFIFMDHFIRFTMPFYKDAISQTADQETEMSQSEEGGLKIEAQIIALIEENPQISMTEIALKLQRARSGIAKRLKAMQQKNMIRRVGPDKGGHWEIISH